MLFFLRSIWNLVKYVAAQRITFTALLKGTCRGLRKKRYNNTLINALCFKYSLFWRLWLKFQWNFPKIQRRDNYISSDLLCNRSIGVLVHLPKGPFPGHYLEAPSHVAEFGQHTTYTECCRVWPAPPNTQHAQSSTCTSGQLVIGHFKSCT